MKVTKLIERLNIIEAGMTVLENIDSDEQSVEMTRKSLEKPLCSYKELLKEKKKNLSVQTSLQDFFTCSKARMGQLEEQ